MRVVLSTLLRVALIGIERKGALLEVLGVAAPSLGDRKARRAPHPLGPLRHRRQRGANAQHRRARRAARGVPHRLRLRCALRELVGAFGSGLGAHSDRGARGPGADPRRPHHRVHGRATSSSCFRSSASASKDLLERHGLSGSGQRALPDVIVPVRSPFPQPGTS